jgi:hypothetical protein
MVDFNNYINNNKNTLGIEDLQKEVIEFSKKFPSIGY